jgi:hypothetical protein
VQRRVIDTGVTPNVVKSEERWPKGKKGQKTQRAAAMSLCFNILDASTSDFDVVIRGAVLAPGGGAAKTYELDVPLGFHAASGVQFKQ